MICRSCHSHELSAQPSGTKYRDYWVTNNEYSLLQCQQCGLLQTDVEVTADFFQNVYPQTYYAHSNEHLKLGSRERIQEYSLKARAGQHLPLRQALMARALRQFVLVELPYIKDGKILDVGCGAGKLLNVAARAGFSTYGVEPAESAFHILVKSGHQAYHSLEEVDAPDEFFDLIVFNQSLEHLPRPFEAIQLAAKKLAPNGTLIVSVPNVASTESQSFRQYWRHIDIPRHLSHFSYDTLQAMLQRAHLTCVAQRFKFWGLPTSSLKMAVKHTGATAYVRLARFFMSQIWAFIRFQPREYGAFMSLYFVKEHSVKESSAH